MVKVYEVSDVRSLIGKFAHECAIELLKQGVRGKRSTRTSPSALQKCIREKFEAETRQRISGLTP